MQRESLNRGRTYIDVFDERVTVSSKVDLQDCQSTTDSSDTLAREKMTRDCCQVDAQGMKQQMMSWLRDNQLTDGRWVSVCFCLGPVTPQFVDLQLHLECRECFPHHTWFCTLQLLYFSPSHPCFSSPEHATLNVTAVASSRVRW